MASLQRTQSVRTRAERRAEEAWENEGGPPAPRKGWVVNREYHERVFDSLFHLDYADLERRMLAAMMSPAFALFGDMNFAKGGRVENRYPYYVGGTITGRWPGRNPPETQEPKRAIRENHTTITINNTFEPGAATKVDAHIRKEAARLRAALEAPYRGDPQALDPYAAFAEYHRGDAAISQAMSKGTLMHKELEEQLRGPSWWKRFTAWLSKLYNPLWCI